MTFELDPRLAADTLTVGDLALCRALLKNDTRYAWIVLVPRRADLAEIADLSAAERAVLIEEIATTSDALRAQADKINVGALGNIVRQLHVHVVARRFGDPAWPGPVWGHGAAEPYSRDAGLAQVQKLRLALAVQSDRA